MLRNFSDPLLFNGAVQIENPHYTRQRLRYGTSNKKEEGARPYE